jgi:hypothetical protein
MCWYSTYASRDDYAAEAATIQEDGPGQSPITER